MGSLDGFDRAIMTDEQAIESIPDYHPIRAGVLNNLGIALENKFGRTGLMGRAMVINEQADYPYLAGRLNILGVVLRCRFDRTRLIKDLDPAIMALDPSVELTTGERPDFAGYLNNLGSALHSRFKHLGFTEDLDRGIATKERAIKSDTVPPIRLKAAQS